MSYEKMRGHIGVDLSVASALMDQTLRPVPVEEVQRTLVLVASMARDAADARELMEVMGLIAVKQTKSP